MVSMERNGFVTPCYVIYRDRFLNNLRDIRDNFRKYWNHTVICGYSCKTNNSRLMLSLAKSFGMYAEVVSAREYALVKEMGYQDENIIFNGPGKGNVVLEACRNGSLVNIDNLQELEFVVEGFFRKYHELPEKLGLRVNFDLESCVPGQTSTAWEDGRFGICYENGDVEKAILFLRNRGIRLSGLHIHYTTKTRSLEVYAAISNMVREIIEKYDLHLDYIDIGGGFWGGRKLEEKPTMEQYARTITGILPREDPTALILEPGSALCSTVAEYWSKVLTVKDVRSTRFVLLDGSCLHINPFLAERNAQWHWQNIDGFETVETVTKQVLCGSTCLEKDRFTIVQNGQAFKPGDIVAFENVGAYTMSFVSDFILDKPQEYLEKRKDSE